VISTRDPDLMTEPQRREEVATLLAAGLLRRVREARAAVSTSGGTSGDASGGGLDLSSETRLSVAPRPAGEEAGLADANPDPQGAA
jgi:hypothetical protein